MWLSWYSRLVTSLPPLCSNVVTSPAAFVDLKVGWQLVQRLKLPRSQWVAFLSHTRVAKGHDQPPPKPKTKEKPSKDQKTNKQTNKVPWHLDNPKDKSLQWNPQEVYQGVRTSVSMFPGLDGLLNLSGLGY
jgi:hypothetical protein